MVTSMAAADRGITPAALDLDTEPGSTHPLGTAVSRDGVNFSIFSEGATEVTLLLFDHASAIEPAGTYYAFRVDGPWNASTGYRFNPNKVLIGPYARGIYKGLWNRAAAAGPDDNLATSMPCAVVDTADYDWEGDRPLKRPFHESIIHTDEGDEFGPTESFRGLDNRTFYLLDPNNPSAYANYSGAGGSTKAPFLRGAKTARRSSTRR